MLGELIPCGGGDPIPLFKESLLVGRRDSCDITLGFAAISSRHCQLEFTDGYWKVTDLGSTNGIRVNGERCQQSWLMPGDILRFAKLEYEVVYRPTTKEPPPEIDEDPFAESLLEKAGLAPRRPRR